MGLVLLWRFALAASARRFARRRTSSDWSAKCRQDSSEKVSEIKNLVRGVLAGFDHQWPVLN
jgi:hypothetical protein